MNKWQRINYQPNLPLEGQRVTASYDHRMLSKTAAKAGMVLLKNDDKVLPLQKKQKVALFGKGTFDYVKGGGGSGDVTVAYTKNIHDGIKDLPFDVEVFEESIDFYRDHVTQAYKNGKEPGLTSEPICPEDLLERSRAFTDTAIVSICRFSGEGWDRKSSHEQEGIFAEPWVEKTAKQSDELFENGDFTLSDAEARLINDLKTRFDKVIVVLNVGAVMDTNWFINDQDIPAVLMAWQGGLEGGSAIAELLFGLDSPSGKLVDTFAKRLEDYPSSYNYHESNDFVEYTDDIYVGYRYFETIPKAYEAVNYPFGFGLSYTTFEWAINDVKLDGDDFEIIVDVKNTGDYEGREVIQVYVTCPQGILGKPSKVLVGFKKTSLLKENEKETVIIKVNKRDFASYDDLGKVKKSAYMLEKGAYSFYVGNSIRNVQKSDFEYTLGETEIIEQLTEKIQPVALNKRLLASGNYESLDTKSYPDPDESVLDKRQPEEVDGYGPETRYRDVYQLGESEQVMSLLDVVNEKVSLDEFMDQLTIEEMVHLLGGQPITGVANTFGFGNLPKYGVPNAMTADGPAGLRINKECGVNTTAWPCSTLLACSWDEILVHQVGEAGAKEVKENNLGVWLTPAVNIHRSPLCGRNFEYYSEDPFLTGKLASAMVKGIQSVGVSATVKHFAFNNKETYRKNSDSRVSERAAREIYLKGFEMIVKDADPWCIMSAYNLVNGQRTSANKELLVDILREEWGYKGAVTTDWWTYGEHYKEIKAGNDIKMACGHPKRVLKAFELQAINEDEIKICAKRVLELLMKLD